MEQMEKRLVKQKRVEEFNEQFRDTVDRGVFQKLSPEKLRGWKGPVNFIAVVEAFRNGPHAAMPVRICMKNSLKQPTLVRKSLNNCLLKGPPTLVDLFIVTLSFREWRYALTKDLSKFYQRVEADEIEQHKRWVMWRDCDKIYVTTTVIMDRPSGCIAIVAMRETEERCGKDLLKAL
jgi:hypothetical protein